MTPASPPQDLSDIEIVRACARAMGSDHVACFPSGMWEAGEPDKEYWPLTDKSQAMGLAYAMQMSIVWGHDGNVEVLAYEDCRNPTPETLHSEIYWRPQTLEHLLHIICLCAARIQLAKEAK